jgi:hypothetical protein
MHLGIRPMFLGLFSLILIATVSVKAHACDAMPMEPALRKADIVFGGVARVVAAAKTGPKGAQVVTFEVARVYKGNNHRQLSVIADKSCLVVGEAFIPGQYYMVYAYSKTGKIPSLFSPPVLSVARIGQTRGWPDMQEDLSYIGSPKHINVDPIQQGFLIIAVILYGWGGSGGLLNH